MSTPAFSIDFLHGKENMLHSNWISGSQTFPVRGPLKIYWWCVKHKILIYIGNCGPFQLIFRTNSGPRLWTLGIAELDIYCYNTVTYTGTECVTDL